MEDPMNAKKKNSQTNDVSETIVGLDLTFQGVKAINSSLFCYNNIKELLLNNNEITEIPKDIFKLKNLERLNLSFNKIKTIPAELGRLVSLKELHLNDNLISTIPMEMGGLSHLEVFNISNNPLGAPFSTMAKEKNLLRFCRENNTNYKSPSDRAWVDTVFKVDSSLQTISVGSFNILWDHYAAGLTYVPSWVVNTECRREIIFQTISAYNMDILGLQEVDVAIYNEFYKDHFMHKLEYQSTILPKRKPDTHKFLSNSYYGQATLWKRNKFKLVEEFGIEMLAKLQNDSRVRFAADALTRMANKTNTTLFTVLLHTALNVPIIVANVHLYYDPAYEDVKLLQTMLLMEELERLKSKHKTTNIFLLGDFNSLPKSLVLDFITQKKAQPKAFGSLAYGEFNEGIKHSINFENSYSQQDISFTNFVPSFKGVIDHIFHSDGVLLTSVLSPIEEEYTERTLGLPNIHFPSDHILIGAKFQFKTKKPNK